MRSRYKQPEATQNNMLFNSRIRNIIRRQTWVTLFLLTATNLWSIQEKGEALSELSISQLEDRLEAINSELDGLSRYSLRSGIGAIGFRTPAQSTVDAKDWVEIDLGQETPIDEVVLVPTIWRDANKGFQADGFPRKFKILAGSEGNSEGVVIFDSDLLDSPQPGIAPLCIPTPGASGSWIRLEANELSQRAFDSKYVLHLAEFIVFHGEENIALNRPVTTGSKSIEGARAWNKRFLVDGFTPYLMDSSSGTKSLAYVSTIGSLPTLILDLGAEYKLSRIHLHSVEQGDTVPQAYSGDLGIPSQLKIEGALLPDFSDAQLLLEYKQESINDIGPMIIRRFPEKTCRYVRLVPQKASLPFDLPRDKFRLGFAEIELYSGGDNVALGVQVKTDSNNSLTTYNRSLKTLTDGNNLYGEILPTRKWLNELSRRHILETEKPIIANELSIRYARQKTILNRTTWLAVGLAVAIAFVILFDRNLRMRQATRIRQRFAADLHDELGANLHSIGLLCDLAKESVDSRDELIELLDRTRIFTERSGMAARYCTNMLEAKGLCEDLVEEMKRTSRRLLADLKYDLQFEGEAILKELSPRKRIDLFFFYKESLTNIIRHSGATEVVTHIVAKENTIHLSITDNGHGIADTSEDSVPPSLKRRARLLRATVSIEHPPEGGTRIALVLNKKRFRIFK